MAEPTFPVTTGENSVRLTLGGAANAPLADAASKKLANSAAAAVLLSALKIVIEGLPVSVELLPTVGTCCHGVRVPPSAFSR